MTLDFSAARLNMIDSQVRPNDVPDFLLQEAMANAPRERFCPAGREFLAYADCEIEYAPGWYLLTPRDMAKLLFAAAPKAGEDAFCLAAPYAAMVLSDLGLKVTLRAPAGPARASAEAALAPRDIAIDAGPGSWRIAAQRTRIDINRSGREHVGFVAALRTGWRCVGVNADENVGRPFVGVGHALPQRHGSIAIAREARVDALREQFALHAAGNGEGQVFFVDAGRTQRAGIRAAMARVDHHAGRAFGGIDRVALTAGGRRGVGDGSGHCQGKNREGQTGEQHEKHRSGCSRRPPITGSP